VKGKEKVKMICCALHSHWMGKVYGLWFIVLGKPRIAEQVWQKKFH
jgi:hypothetical protein